MHLNAILGELLRDQIAGALLGEAELGMGVDVASDRAQLVGEFEHLGDDRHDGSGGERVGELVTALSAASRARAAAATEQAGFAAAFVAPR